MSAHPLPSNELLFAQNVQPKATTPGVAQDSAPASSGGPPAGSPLGSMMPILMMLVIFVPFFLLMSRRQKKEAQARSSLKKGDRVIANGILGDLVEMDDRIAKVKIAPGITVQILAANISPYAESAPKSASAAPAKELKEAKAGSDKK